MRRSRELERAAGLQEVRRALPSRITPALRAVAIKVDRPVVWTRYLYDGEPGSLEQAMAEATGADVGAGMPGRWLSQVLLRTVPSDAVLSLEPGEEWAYIRPDEG